MSEPTDTEGFLSPPLGTTSYERTLTSPTFSSLSQRYSSHSVTSRSDSERGEEDLRRVIISPSASTYDDDDTFTEGSSFDERSEVERALLTVEDELANAEDALTEWGSLAPRNSRLSTIAERTEPSQSRPSSFAHNILGFGSGSRPSTMYQQPANASSGEVARRSIAGPSRSSTPTGHARAATEPPGHGTIDRLNRSGKAGELIAMFEGISSPPPTQSGHTRTGSAPAGPRSPSPFLSSSYGRTFDTTSYGSRSRPSSPTKSSFSTSYSYTQSPTLSSLLSPPTGGLTTTGSSSLYRPSQSSRSPLTSVRNAVAAWKDRAPGPADGSQPETSTRSQDRSQEGFFSLRRRAERGTQRLHQQALEQIQAPAPGPAPVPAGGNGGNGGRGLRRRSSGGGAMTTDDSSVPYPFDISELSSFARGSAEPLRVGLLWYLNVHTPPPFRWQRCQALLYPNMLLLSWIAPGGGRGIVTLDLLNCTEVRSTPSPTHPSAHDDIGTVAARIQSAGGPNEDQIELTELLCPFQLLYSDGAERLAAESSRERVRWVSAIWEALDRSVTMPDDRSMTRSPTGSIRTIDSLHSSAYSRGSGSNGGSSSTVFMPPLDTIPDLSDLDSRSSLTSYARPARTADDATVSDTTYLYPGDRRHIRPSRSSSIRRTTSMTDLDSEFQSRDQARLSRTSEESGSGSDDRFFSATSGTDQSRTSSFYSTLSPTHTQDTGTRDRRTTITPMTQGTTITATGTGTDTGLHIRQSTLSPPQTTTFTSDLYTRSRSVTPTQTSTSYLDTGVSPSLTRSSALRSSPGRRGRRRSYGTRTSTSQPSTEESDKENEGSISGLTHDSSKSYSASDERSEGSYTHASRSDSDSRGRSYSDYTSGYTGLSTLETRSSPYTYSYDSRSGSSYSPYSGYTGSQTPSGYGSEPLSSHTPSQPSSGTDEYVTASQRTSYFTATARSTSPSILSFESLPSIPSFDEYATVEECPSTPGTSEYKTATLCPSESEYTTAPLCSCSESGDSDYHDAECRCKRTPSVSSKTPTTLPDIPSPSSTEVSLPGPEGIPLPASVTDVSSPPPSLPEEIPEEIEEEQEEEETRPPSVSTEPSLLDTLSETVDDISVTEASFPTPRESLLDAPSSLTASSISDITPSSTEPRSPPSPSSESSPSITETEAPIPIPEPMPPVPPILDSESWIETQSIPETESTVPIPVPVPAPISRSPSLSTTETKSEPSSVTHTEPPETEPLGTEPPEVEPLGTEPPETEPPETIPEESIPESEDRTPTPTPTVPPPSPSARSLWAAESDFSYETSVLRPSPTTISMPIPDEGPDISYDTSFLRPTASYTSQLERLTRVTESSESGSEPSEVSSASAESESTFESSESSAEVSPMRTVILSRSPSSVSTVSSIGSSILRPTSLYDVPGIILEHPTGTSPSTVPSLLSHEAEPTPPSTEYGVSPRNVPLPSSPTPSPSAPSVPFSVSISSPQTFRPSINSILETVPSSVSSASSDTIITHDVNRLLQFLYDMDANRGGENRDLRRHIIGIENELGRLADSLRNAPPPVPDKGRLSPRPHLSPRPLQRWPSGPREQPGRARSRSRSPHLVPIPITPPPPIRIPSPSTLTTSVSWLESPHSDDFSLMQEEPYADMPSSPSWSSSSSSSSFSSSSSSGDPGEPEDLPLQSSSLGTSPPVSSSPAPSTASSSTVRPTTLRDSLEALRNRVGELADGQRNAQDALDDLRGRQPSGIDADTLARLQRMEEMLGRLLARQPVQPAPPPPAEPESPALPIPPRPPTAPTEAESDIPSETTSQAERFWRQSVGLHQPRPTHAVAPEDWEALMHDNLETPRPIGGVPDVQIQMPAPLHTVTYQRRPFQRAPSPEPISRAQTVPVPRPPPPPRRRPGQVRPTPPPMATMRDQRSRPEVPPPTPMLPSAISPPRMLSGVPVDTGPDIDMLAEINARRQNQLPPARPILFDRGGTAPPATGRDRPPISDTWYRTRRDEGQPEAGPSGEQDEEDRVLGNIPIVPPVGQFTRTGQRQPGPEELAQLAGDLRAMLDMLRENQTASMAGLEQQQEITTYMRDLNTWFERDMDERARQNQHLRHNINLLFQEMRNMRAGQPAGAATAPGGGPNIFIPPPPGQFAMGPPGMGIPTGPVIPDQIDTDSETGTPSSVPGPRLPLGGGPVFPPPFPMPMPFPVSGAPTSQFPLHGGPVYPPGFPTPQPGGPGAYGPMYPGPGHLGPGPMYGPGPGPYFQPYSADDSPPFVPPIYQNPNQGVTVIPPPPMQGGLPQPGTGVVVMPSQGSDGESGETSSTFQPSRRSSPTGTHVMVEHPPPPPPLPQGPPVVVNVQPQPLGQGGVVVAPSGNRPGSSQSYHSTHRTHTPRHSDEHHRTSSPGRTEEHHHHHYPSRPSSGHSIRSGSPTRHEGGVAVVAPGEPPIMQYPGGMPMAPGGEGVAILPPPTGYAPTGYVPTTLPERPFDHQPHYPPGTVMTGPGGPGYYPPTPAPPQQVDINIHQPPTHHTRTQSSTDHHYDDGIGRQVSGTHRPGTTSPRPIPAPQQGQRPSEDTDRDGPDTSQPQRGATPSVTPQQHRPPSRDTDRGEPDTFQPQRGQTPTRPPSAASRFQDPRGDMGEWQPRPASSAAGDRDDLGGWVPTRTPEGSIHMDSLRGGSLRSAGPLRDGSRRRPRGEPTIITVRPETDERPMFYRITAAQPPQVPAAAAPLPVDPSLTRDAPALPPQAQPVHPTETAIPIPPPVTPIHAHPDLYSDGRSFDPAAVDAAESERERRFAELAQRTEEALQAVRDAEERATQRTEEALQAVREAEERARQAEEARDAVFREREEERERQFAESEGRREEELARQRDEAMQHMGGTSEGFDGDLPSEGGMRHSPPDGSPPRRTPPIGTPPFRPTDIADTATIVPGLDEGGDLGESFVEEEPSFPPPSVPVSRMPSMRPSVAPRSPPVPVAELVSAIEEERRARQQLDEERARVDEERAGMDEARAALDAERAAHADEREARIRALEDELAQAKADLAGEKEERIFQEQERRAAEDARREEEAAQREQEASNRELESQANLERHESLHNQLGGLTDLVQQMMGEAAEKKQRLEERWSVEDVYREDKMAKMQSLLDMVQQLADEHAEEKERAAVEREANEGKPTFEELLEQLRNQHEAQVEAITNLMDALRADSARHHEDTLNAVRSTAQEQVPFNVQGYLDEFSKALASEVRMLLGEVGKLREEKRSMQYELGCLMVMKSKYGPGGEFDPDWKPDTGSAGPPPDSGPPPPPTEPMPSRPAWRTMPTPRVASRKSKKARESTPAPAPVPEAAPFMPPPMVDPRTHSWATWQPQPGMELTPPSNPIAPTLLHPETSTPGLFGPRSPSNRGGAY